ncbi:uncharacterized protein LOC113332918 [Papaver somniferum]|uniref:uncharacterized protein LOC113332918 n=1 Tax=Papaver somniferum TaxID=3469 RepID=UPI000E702BE5|nr:uncharacterized protein LOC113332918 [Papaver somniferum]
MKSECRYVDSAIPPTAVDKILVDSGSSVDVLFYHTFKEIGYDDINLAPVEYDIFGFNGTATIPKGEITLTITIDTLETIVTFSVVEVDIPYNAIIRRPWIHGVRGITSTFHQCIRFPVPDGIGEIKGDIIQAKECKDLNVRHQEGRKQRKKDKKKMAREVKQEREFQV